MLHYFWFCLFSSYWFSDHVKLKWPRHAPKSVNYFVDHAIFSTRYSNFLICQTYLKTTLKIFFLGLHCRDAGFGSIILSTGIVLPHTKFSSQLLAAQPPRPSIMSSPCMRRLQFAKGVHTDTYISLVPPLWARITSFISRRLESPGWDLVALYHHGQLR